MLVFVPSSLLALRFVCFVYGRVGIESAMESVMESVMEKKGA